MTSSPCTTSQALRAQAPAGRVFWVRRTRIIGTQVAIYSALEPWAGHTSFTTMDDAHGQPHVRMGHITTRPLPQDVAQLPAGSLARVAACNRLRSHNQALALAIINRAFPGILDDLRAWARGGEVETQEPGTDTRSTWHRVVFS